MADALNLIGKKFGKLTVVERVANDKRNNTMWRCVCDCGNEKIALGYDLAHGRTTTCGCNAKGRPSSNRISLVGKKYGTLTVVSLNDDRSGGGKLYWNCICDCGAEVVMSGGNLKSKDNPSHKRCPLKNMPHNFIDLTGKRFGRLVVQRRSSERDYQGRVLWECKCDCGGEKVTCGEALRSGSTMSCGCLLKEQRKAPKRTTHNMTKTRIYKLYRGMIGRCSPNYHGAKNYYDRGIRVCDEWSGDGGFERFCEWSYANGYDETKTWIEMSIDRIDGNGNYEPSNCRWVTYKAQANNTRVNVVITYNGETKTLKQWSEHLNLSYPMLKMRRKRGKTPPELFLPPQR